MKQKKRLCIFSFYESEGIVDRYVEYYIKSLLEVVDNIVITVNGDISDEGLKRLKLMTPQIFIRENKGFDAGAGGLRMNNQHELSTKVNKI